MGFGNGVVMWVKITTIAATVGGVLRSAKFKVFLIAITSVSVVGVFSATYYIGYRSGAASEREVYEQAIRTWQDRTVSVLEELEELQLEREQDTAERIEVIRYVEDPSGCADHDMPSGIIEQLH